MSTITYDITLEQWQDPRNPVRGPLPGPRSAIDRWVPHWEGLTPLGRMTNWDVLQNLRNIQHWWTNRPTNRFSIGYNDALVSIPGHMLNGALIEIRGQRFRGAATGGINLVSHATLVLQRQGDHATPEAVARAHRLITELRADSPKIDGPDRLIDHGRSGSTTVTSCAGPGLRADIDNGVFWPRASIVPPPPITKDLHVKPYPYSDARILDTRVRGDRVHAGQTVTARIPDRVQGVAVMLNVAIVDSSGPGYITVWGSGPRPDTSVQQTSARGQTITGTTYVQIGSDGNVRVYSSGECHLLVDIVAVGA